MRSVWSVVSCACLALVMSACNKLDERYTREGVGTDLYTAELPDAVRLQEIYVGYICQQAGLSYDQVDGGLICREPPVTPNWQVFVQAGMNDIDRRCDGYLTWLDNRRRWEGPISQQIVDTQAASLAIMTATAVDPVAIAVVAAAFGLASHSFTNFNSRLLFEVDKSTVQSVVLTRQQDFRKGLPTLIDNRPAAIYALRQYLRLCMPLTIETQINTTVKLFERGGVAALSHAASHPMIDPHTVSTATTTRITDVARDDSRTELRSLLFPNGKADPDRAAYVRRLLGDEHFAIGPILVDANFASLRRRLSACIIARNDGRPCADGSLAQFVK